MKNIHNLLERARITLLCKVFILALMLIPYSVHKHVDVVDMLIIETTENNHTVRLKINPEGALSPSRGYVMHKSRYMHNMRQYFSEINIEYFLVKLNSPMHTNNQKLSIGEDLSEKCAIHSRAQEEAEQSDVKFFFKYYKAPKRDAAHLIAYKKDILASATLQAFAQQVIHMFPSENGYLSIDSQQKDSFTRLLRNQKSDTDSIYLLAALLLLSEGVCVPLNVVEDEEKDTRLILPKLIGNGYYIDLDMFLADGIDGREKEAVYQKKTEDIVCFFKDAGEKAAASETLYTAEPAKYKQFMSGEFMNTPQFLIQSYIYEFIDSADMYIKFVGAVYTLLTDYINNIDGHACNKKEHAQKVLNGLFMQRGGDLAPSEYTAYLCKLAEAREYYTATPFISDLQAPKPISVHTYRKNPRMYSAGIDSEYCNYVEATLLGLFCCFAFDPETRKYTTEHMPSPSKELQEFFNKYSEPEVSVDYAMHKEWCGVVSSLDCGKVIYLRRDRNQIGSGILNILRAIQAVAGSTKNIDDAISELNNIRVKETLDKEDREMVESALQAVFKSLSKNKRVTVQCGKIKISKLVGMDRDLYLAASNQIRISYVRNNAYGEVHLKISCDCPEISIPASMVLIGAEEKKKLVKIQKESLYPSTYMQCLMHQYLNILLKQITQNEQGKYVINKKTKHMIRNIHDSPNALLLWGSLENLEYKACIVKQVLLQTSSTPLDTDNRVVRFTANLIGSVPLDDLYIRRRILMGCLYNRNYRQYYPRIEYDDLQALSSDEAGSAVSCLVADALSIDISSAAFISAFESVLHAYRNAHCMFWWIASEYACIGVLENLCKENNPQTAYRDIVVLRGLSSDSVGGSGKEPPCTNKKPANALSRHSESNSTQFDHSSMQLKSSKATMPVCEEVILHIECILRLIARNMHIPDGYCINDIYMCWLVHISSWSKKPAPSLIKLIVCELIDPSMLSGGFMRIIPAGAWHGVLRGVCTMLLSCLDVLFTSHNSRGRKKYMEILDFFTQRKKTALKDPAAPMHGLYTLKSSLLVFDMQL
ncbi:uncharacterized protein NEPG_02585 [Nematocida parisii ERTm1]|uniref:Uncharacterized protein n=1 Tax=Nematocida parisii (strain ERTm3) TaxID=935791 RepID=I3EE94_NEMP3|nr:uncharacterized protein NEPG_02585 [Nematocida parisii ERTm1]EIJ87541.1 hypothetical protein NEQG_02088 [Nematocida parisii ERTm3]EIJ92571.1 hypothetical protein NEPG_02585 [Nematocida parisii ERTm1]KAI5145929.1 hypothetical protein NEPAR07_1965 [Nematocida parisii]|eukprot:XP_013060412.1 hypothetical protein NEPG_02585 [Nematocida parisii ERTm1]